MIAAFAKRIPPREIFILSAAIGWLIVLRILFAWFGLGNAIRAEAIAILAVFLPADMIREGEIAFFFQRPMEAMLLFLVCAGPPVLAVGLLSRRWRIAAGAVSAAVLLVFGLLVAGRTTSESIVEDSGPAFEEGSVRASLPHWILMGRDSSLASDSLRSRRSEIGEQFRGLRLEVPLDARVPGVVRTTCTFLPASSGSMRVEKFVDRSLAMGPDTVTVEFRSHDFVGPIIWARPNPHWKGHPSWVEGWSSRVEIDLARPAGRLANGDSIWLPVDSKAFELSGFKDLTIKDTENR